MIYGIPLAMILLFVFYQKEQLNDLKTGRNTRWKMWGWFIKFLFLITVCFFQIKLQRPWLDVAKDAVLSGVIMYIFFETMYNKIVLKKANIFYEGHSSWMDDKWGKIKLIVLAVALAGALLFKFL